MNAAETPAARQMFWEYMNNYIQLKGVTEKCSACQGYNSTSLFVMEKIVIITWWQFVSESSCKLEL